MNANARVWMSPALAGVAMLAILALFHATAAEVVGVWNQSGTYTHGYVVLPLACWLMWRERASILEAGFRPGWWAVPAMLACAGLWLAGDLAGVSVASHLGLAGMLMCCVWAAFGNAAARRAWFGIGFMIFAVPFGDFLLPVMMEHTADFTVWALRLTGVPVYREGLNFVIPSGHWSVVEACSGLRYLIASVMVGALFAYLNYSSLWRRILFFVAACLVPLLANWVRAYLIVMTGHLSGNTLAVGVDHLIYGWVFFGFVMFLLFWVGGWWRDDVEPKAYQSVMADQVSMAPRGQLLATFCVLALGVGVLLAAAGLRQEMSGRVVLQAPAAAEGWRVTTSMVSNWQPTYVGKRATLARTYQRGAESLTLYVAYYAGQDSGSELVQWANQLVDDTPPVRWRILSQAAGQVAGMPTRSLSLAGEQTLRVWHWYWLGGTTTTSDTRAKLDLALKRLTLQPDDSAAVYLMVADGPQAQATADEFLRAHGAAIESMLRGARQP